MMCSLAFVPAAPGRADQIATATDNYRGAKIVGLEGGELRFRIADGSLHGAWIDEVTLIIVDRSGVFDDFNQAERFFADGEPGRAVIRYRRSLRRSEGFWEDLIVARLLGACDAAKQLDTATLNFIRLLRCRWAGPAAAARLIPKVIPTSPNRRTTRAVEQLDAALSQEPGETHRALLEMVRYDVLRHTKDGREKQAARRVATLSIPPEARSRRVCEIQLHALRAALKEAEDPAVSAGLQRAIRDCPDGTLPGLLLLKGETLLAEAVTREDVIRASWPFLRVAIHFPDDPRAADGLYGAALALTRLGRNDKAMELLDECLDHKLLTDRTRRLAESARTRLESVGDAD